MIDGLVLSGMRPTFVAPELDPELGIAHCLTPGLARRGARRDARARSRRWSSPPPTSAPAPTSPRLAEVAHERGVPLVVDEAWGAHLRFHPDLPPDALGCGADLVVSSTHKIVGSLTQAAMLHLGEGGRDRRGGRRPLRQPGRNDQPQRPALGGSLDAARRQASVHGERLLGETLAAIAATREAIARDPRARGARRQHGRPAPGSPAGTRCGSAIDVRGTGSTGYRLAKAAFELDGGIDLELSSENVVVAIFGLGEPAAARRRAAGRRRCARRSSGSARARPARPHEPLAPPPPWGELAMTPREAFLGPQEVVPFDDAAGRVAAEALAAYPPGIPNVLPGERLTRETLDYIAESVAHGGHVRGGSDRELKTLRVAR